MKIVSPSVEIVSDVALRAAEKIRLVERAYRICYNSERSENINDAIEFIRRRIEEGHESPLEHVHITVEYTVDRGIADELTRHRIAAYSMQSTRYCNYSKGKYGGEVTFILPSYLEKANDWRYATWKDAMERAEAAYMDLINGGVSPQNARGVLPFNVATKLLATHNLREWRHIFRLRCDPAAHPDMQRMMGFTLKLFRGLLPPFFDDIEVTGGGADGREED